MPYIPARDVHSPKAQWQLVDVIIDGGPGGASYAMGNWENERRVGFRWNGTDENPIGNPQSRGLPTWTMLDSAIHAAVIALAPKEKQALLSAFLQLPKRTELKVDWHPSGRRTLKEREDGDRMYHDLFSVLDAGEFYRKVVLEVATRLVEHQHVTFHDTHADHEDPTS
jgi:hypothetical protein